jgi:exonuclease SbcC
MKLLRLEAEGIRSFRNRVLVDFETLGAQGLFAIVGPTGAGKSSLLDALFLALFDQCPRGKATDCVNPQLRDMRVRVELELEGLKVAVERRYHWSPKRAAKHEPLRLEQWDAASTEGTNGKWNTVDLQGERADDYLRTRWLKLGRSEFEKAVVLPQGAFDALLKSEPKDRRTLIASLFRTDHLGDPLAAVVRLRAADARTEMLRLEQTGLDLRPTGEAKTACLAAMEAARAQLPALEQGVLDGKHRQAALEAGVRAWTERVRLEKQRDEAQSALQKMSTKAAQRLPQLQSAGEKFTALREQCQALKGQIQTDLGADPLKEVLARRRLLEQQLEASQRALTEAQAELEGLRTRGEQRHKAQAQNLLAEKQARTQLVQQQSALMQQEQALSVLRRQEWGTALAEDLAHCRDKDPKSPCPVCGATSKIKSPASSDAAEEGSVEAHGPRPTQKAIKEQRLALEATQATLAKQQALMATLRAQDEADVEAMQGAKAREGERAEQRKRSELALVEIDREREVILQAREARWTDALSRLTQAVRVLLQTAPPPVERMARELDRVPPYLEQVLERVASGQQALTTERDQMQEALTRGQTELSAAERELERVQGDAVEEAAPGAVPGAAEPTVEGAAERLRVLTAELAQAKQAMGEQERALQQGRADVVRLRSELAALEQQEQRAVDYHARAALLRPRVERLQRMEFLLKGAKLSAAAAEHHFGKVIGEANQLLLDMTRGRFRLDRTAEQHFVVLDQELSGQGRSPSTLSGGETFLVSLALALGLSHQIQAAGRTRCDFFFLDEGFGSLDPESIDQVMGALERLRAEGRTIGMITHVAAVAERVPRRLRVIPGRMESGARVVLEQ